MWQWMRNTLIPLFLILVCPIFVMMMWYTNTELNGSFQQLNLLINHFGLGETLLNIWLPHFWGSKLAWKIIFIFIFFEFILMRFLPGRIWHGPISAKGTIPVYKANGILAFTISIFVFCFASFVLNLFPASILYDNFGDLLGALNILSLITCVGLYVKGRYFPSTIDCGLSHNFIFDYYWGTELYPQLFGINIKKFITCRFGMMSWGLILLSYCGKQMEFGGISNALLISVILQFIYLAKFYIWEGGYLRSIDIMHDRAGFYICWGCMVWVPGIYTSASMYLVNHPIHLNLGLASFILLAGSASIIINYLADHQRLITRASNGECRIWGKPPKVLLAEYFTENGERKKSLLLASGWWSISRHFHYIPEILGAFFWTVPALFNHFAPYFYVCFLTILLFHRAYRDEIKCANKYGDYWKKYCNLVPYKIIPFVI